MIIREVEVSKRIFNDIYYRYLQAQQPIQIFYGGASAGKSIFLAQRTVLDLMGGGRNYLILRNVARTSRQSTFAEVKKNLGNWKIEGLFDVNKSDLTITCKNGYQAIFAGLDDVEKLKSITPVKGVLTDIWIEEATEVQRNDALHLERRLRGKSRKRKRMTLSFNPILKSHWIYEDYFQGINSQDQTYEDEEKLIVKVTYKDNKFLSEQDIIRLENTTDEYFYQVYTLGNWGVLGDVIFKNWEIVDSLDVSTFSEFRYGLDFGYSSDPAAFVKLAINNRKKHIYILDELYERGLTNPELAALVKPKIGKSSVVVADSSEPKSIKELQLNGLPCIGAEKGPDSVLFGIQWLQQYKIFILKHCQNAINEFQSYQWQKNKDGESLRRPVDKFNHIIDAIRYACEQDMKGEVDFNVVSTGRRRASAGAARY